MADTEQPKPKKTPNILLLRGSVILFALRLILVVVLFSVIRFTIRIPILYFGLDKETILYIYNINTFITFILILAEIYLILAVTIHWVNEYYEIIPGRITHRKGFFSTKEQIYTCEHVQSIDLEQGFFGKLFNYGTISLFSPALEEKIFLDNIDKPTSYMKNIQNILNIKPEDQSKKTSVFFRG